MNTPHGHHASDTSPAGATAPRRPARPGRTQGLWHVLLVLSTMVACAWLAVPDFAEESAPAQTLASAGGPGEPR